jgi:lipopolysaccharide export system protein LptC
MTYKIGFISLSLMMIAGFLTWTSVLFYTPKTDKTRTTSHLPDALMENVTALIMDKQGKPKLKIKTPKLVHFKMDDMTQFTTPEVTLYRKSPNPWLIKSRQAKATQGIENIDFWDHVSIQHAADDNNPSTNIKTTALTVHPNKNLAETTHHITLVQPSLIVKALGMHANLNTGDIKLLSQARGEYVPGS